MSQSKNRPHLSKIEVWQLLQEPEWKVAEKDREEADASALRQDTQNFKTRKLVNTAVPESLFQPSRFRGA